jgi:hypothetical protein
MQQLGSDRGRDIGMHNNLRDCRQEGTDERYILAPKDSLRKNIPDIAPWTVACSTRVLERRERHGFHVHRTLSQSRPLADQR